MSKKIRELEKDILKLEKTEDNKFKDLLNQYVGIQAKKDQVLQLKQLTEAQQKKLSVQHYDLHIPATATKEQLQFIMSTAKAVMENQPLTIVHEEAMQFLLRIAVQYRNILEEFDESRRWSAEDDISLRKITREFGPILEWLAEQYRLDISKLKF